MNVGFWFPFTIFTKNRLMQSTLEKIRELFASFSSDTIETIDKLPQSGSDRIYFRLTANGKTYIVTYNLNKKENKTFIAFSEHFKQYGSPVPFVYGFSDDETLYIQEDFGSVSLMDVLQTEGYT